MPDFKNYLTGLSPSWLRQSKGEVVMRSLGDVKDSLVERARAAVMVRFASFAPDDGLAQIGVERQIPRAVGESRASYASRLKGAWSAWKYAGTPTGLLRALWHAGYTNCVLLINQERSYTLDADLNVVVTTYGSITLDSALWNTFRVLFPSPLPASWVSGGVPASNSDEANAIRLTIRKWKPAFARCEKITIQTSGLMWGYPSTQVWGGSGLAWGGTTTDWDY